ncbi:MAG: hypothetical protein HDR80_06740 [Bacteroides sp.]|nr:hypothetical protein [Bacteroides sp.]
MNTEKILIAYFARKGHETDSNSAKLAVRAGELLKARGEEYNSFAIVPVEIYPENQAEFEAITKEENRLHRRPELVGKYSGMKNVERILLIAPNWWEALPNGVLTFFDDYDFTGKRIVPVISTRDDAKKVRQEVSNFLPNTWVLDGVDVVEGNTASADAELNAALDQLFQPSTSKY